MFRLETALGRMEAARLRARIARESCVAILPEGIQLLAETNQPVIPWDALVEVAFEWDENPWSDPQFGRYNDMSWVLKLADSRQYRIDDCEAHRLVLQAAFSMYLPGYSSVPPNVDMTYAKESGRLSCWVKAI